MSARILFALALLGLASPARAGDAEPNLLLVNMTPDGVSPEGSRACTKAIESKLKASYYDVRRMGETKLRKLAGKPTEPFMGWPVETFAAITKGIQERTDVILLLDCRPEAQTLDVALSPPVPAVSRWQLRKLPLDAKGLDVFFRAFERRALVGYQP